MTAIVMIEDKSRFTMFVFLPCLRTFCLIVRDLVFEAINELNGISETANCAFFYSFVPWLAGLAKSTIILPRTVKELEHVSALYRVVKLPECAGSADCVHVFWDTCPAHLQSHCKGKEKFPSLVFEVVASHTKKILSVSGIRYGTDNDKTISRSDSAIL